MGRRVAVAPFLGMGGFILSIDIKAIEEARNTYGPSNCWTGTSGKLATYIDQLLKERALYVGPKCVAIYSEAEIYVHGEKRPCVPEMESVLGVAWHADRKVAGDALRWRLDHQGWSIGLVRAEWHRDRFWKLFQFVHHTFPRLQFVWPDAVIEFYGRFRCGQCGRDLGLRHSAPDECPRCGRFNGMSDGIQPTDTNFLQHLLFMHKAYGGKS
jgi:hypothetical protein